MKLAVFDLDGTITRHDTLLPFVLGFLLRAPWRLPGLLLFLPAAIGFALGGADRGRLKSALIRATLGGSTRSSIDSWTARFVARLLAGGVFADALHAIARHKSEGARLVLLSASTDLYVPAIAQALGFEEAICTGVRWAGDRLDGHLTSPNRRGAEKARCLESLRQRYPGIAICAYGNARSDLEHLALAEQPLLVNASASTRREAARLGIPRATWR
ncbi:MAG: HAD-IB family phosphatase [Steroidobacteraceae bacterium]